MITSTAVDSVVNTDKRMETSRVGILESINKLKHSIGGLQIFPSEKSTTQQRYDNDVPFLDLHISISNGFVSSKICGKR